MKRIKPDRSRTMNSHHGARELSPLQPGNQVWLPQRQSEGEVQEEVAPQSYSVATEGDTIRRNRRDLIRLPTSEIVGNLSRSPISLSS